MTVLADRDEEREPEEWCVISEGSMARGEEGEEGEKEEDREGGAHLPGAGVPPFGRAGGGEDVPPGGDGGQRLGQSG